MNGSGSGSATNRGLRNSIAGTDRKRYIWAVRVDARAVQLAERKTLH